MRFIEIFRAIFTNILAHKFRVFLTALGIIVGSLTIVLVVGIGKGSEEAVKAQFARLNVGTIWINPFPGISSPSALTPDDLKELLNSSPSLNDATILISGKTEMSNSSTSYTGYVLGVNPNFGSLNNLKLTSGEFISEEDLEQKKMVAVIGDELARILFSGDYDQAVGKYISVDRRKFQIIGVAERLGDFAQGYSIDEAVILPFEVAKRNVLGSGVKPRIIAQAKDLESVKPAIGEINNALRKLKGRYCNDFIIRDAGSSLVAAKESSRTMSFLMVSIGIIVLIVGGIGIMNVLLVSVKERTREIGILKAIGTKKADILMQFLLESVIISTSGGLTGIFLGMVIIPIIQNLQIKIIPTTFSNILALVFSVATGTVFGYFPALKAASLKPIEALNYE